MKKLLTILAVIICLGACAGHLKSAVKNGAIAPAFNDTLVDGEYLWVRGFGAANPKHTSDSQRRILSREAAIAQAYQRASEVIYGADLESNIQVVDAVSESSTIHTSSTGLLNRMEIVSTEYLDDGGCSVIMRLPRAALQAAGLNVQESK